MREMPEYHPPMRPLEVVYHDDFVLVVDKPAGLLSVPGKDPGLADCLEARVKGQWPGALLVHRLDMDTSGLMVFARKPSAQRHLGRQFETRQVSKTYLADVDGRVIDDAGEVDLPLIVDWPNRPLQKVCSETGKPALTRWEVVARSSDHTRLRLFPQTGRSHQLRVHMLAIGHPILGDRFYAPEPVCDAASRLHLHAHILCFVHPVTGESMTFESPCPF